jgi:hypothetical protein
MHERPRASRGRMRQSVRRAAILLASPVKRRLDQGAHAVAQRDDRWSRPRARSAVRYVVIRRARDHRCRAERGVLRVRWPIGCVAAALTLDVGWSARVIPAGRDERTLLRFSRISIARCADVIRSSASAWGPLSWSVHPVAGARATGQRPCAQDLRPGRRWQYGRTPAAGDGGRGRVGMVPAARAGERAVRVPGMAGAWRGI